MRGDRPSTVSRTSAPCVAAPHARGSTRGFAALTRVQMGCPACAGIDPIEARASISSGRLPRMRGDRPLRVLLLPRVALAAPHARGSTRDDLLTRSPRPGCPACAGIDPAGAGLGSASSRLPRMRGDRPNRANASDARARAAPHARGSTPSLALGAPTAGGCPACAGIDLRTIGRPKLRPWLPRMRGDRPNVTEPDRERARAAPHARGSTRDSIPLGRRNPGCPACAGIDPPCRRRWMRSCRLPPACAGIDPGLTVLTLRNWRLPRMRGDRPRERAAAKVSRMAAPHARGSTRKKSRSGPNIPGCPACAGIDPIALSHGWTYTRLPRMRGDRPGT